MLQLLIIAVNTGSSTYINSQVILKTGGLDSQLNGRDLGASCS